MINRGRTRWAASSARDACEDTRIGVHCEAMTCRVCTMPPMCPHIGSRKASRDACEDTSIGVYHRSGFVGETGIAVDVVSGVERLTSTHVQFHVMLVRTQALAFTLNTPPVAPPLR